MCGIVGYTGGREACPVLLDGLKRLEYRGYDSAGIAVFNDGRVAVHKAAGKLSVLASALDGVQLGGSIGIGHTRWATHGRPSDENAHPHVDCSGEIVVVHNGIIENYLSLKEDLVARGHRFTSETDTEVVAHLVEEAYDGDLAEAVRQAILRLDGSFALAVMCRHEPNLLVAARRHSPLVVGVGSNENFIASDVPAFLAYTKRVHFIEDDTVAVINRTSVEFRGLDGRPIVNNVHEVEWDAAMAERGGYEHFMLKEIHEQPVALRETMRGRLSSEHADVALEGLGLSDEDIRSIDKIVIVACGTAYHAAMAGKYMIERLVRLPVELDVASELRYRDPIIDDRTLALVISQSGETADTLAGLREARRRGARVLAVCNVVGSSVARESGGVLYTYAGPEIAVASTKAYTTQLMVLALIALHFGRVRGALTPDRDADLRRMLWTIPEQADLFLADYGDLIDCAERYHNIGGFLYMGRGPNLASALEGALKIKEIAYIHAEGYAAGEMKHGPIAMIDPTMATVAVSTKGRTYEKVLSNILEVKARMGEVIAVAGRHDEEIAKYADHIIRVPETDELLSPILNALPLQLLAYHVAKFRGHEIDQPRNLAKSVTVE
ncbi:MAG: glutamine--fructose-6-phosphate transaminase (isomerizing) [Armatimonadetes bacterium]|nr:glutamine--fructose-6-phosphate transaminase (isomerizing) [Armatimonadota bacterium]